ncbi:MAG: hypothetical protein K0R68_2704, partial [Mycobacterium sp.]|nr:hypothetical protein [Mycobacterium sp.]
MFDGLPDPATHAELSRAAMISAIEGYDRAEATCAARKLALIHRLLRDHEDSAAADEQTWAHDTWAAV